MGLMGAIAEGYNQAMPRIDARHQLATENARANEKQQMWLAQQQRQQDAYDMALKEKAANRILAANPSRYRGLMELDTPMSPEDQDWLETVQGQANPQMLFQMANFLTQDEQMQRDLMLKLAGKTPTKPGTDPMSVFKRLYGRDPSPEEYKDFVNSTKGKGQNITIMPGAKKYAEKEAEATVNALSEAIKNRASITQMMPKFDFMEQSDIYTGLGGDFIQNLRRLTGAKSAAEGDILEALSNQFAMYARGPASGMGLPGAISEKEIPFLMKSMPGLLQSTKGRQALAKFMRAASQAQLTNIDSLLNARMSSRDEGKDFNVFDYSATAPIETVNMADFFGDLDAQANLDGSTPAAQATTDGGNVKPIRKRYDPVTKTFTVVR